MRYVLPLVALGVSASATHVSNQNSQCTFPMTAVSNPGGPIVREAIGNNRIGGASSLQDVYSIGQRSMSDSHGYDCMIDPSSSRFYCSQDAHANANFSVANDGRLLHNGSAKWLACEATGPDASGSYHIYTDQKHDTTGCKDITINTGVTTCEVFACPAPASSDPTPTKSESISTATVSSLSSPTVKASSIPSPTVRNPSCPTDISSGEFRFPLLILPTSPEAPDYAFGNSYVAYISNDNTTIFNFDVPQSSLYSGTCALLFLFPYAATLSVANSPFYFSGIEQEVGADGGLDFALLEAVADPQVTYSSTPPVDTDYGKTQVLPGNNYTIATFPCQSGMTSYSVSSVGDVELDFFQNSNSDPIGLFIVPCSS